MDNNTKWMLLAGVAGVGLWWWFTQGSANASLAAHIPPTPIPTPQSPTPSDQVQTPAVTTSGGIVAIAPAQAVITAQGQQVSALLQWAQTTKNPALYEQMIDQASATDLAGLYDLLTTYWAGKTATPTAAQTAFWNNLRTEYPFLNTGGVGCSNLACT
jgi:hypothetical protein